MTFPLANKGINSLSATLGNIDLKGQILELSLLTARCGIVGLIHITTLADKVSFIKYRLKDDQQA